MSMGENAKKVFNMPSFVAYLSFDMLMQVVALCKGSRPRKIFEQHFRIERRVAPIIGRLRDRLDLAYRLQLCGAAIRVLRSAQNRMSAVISPAVSSGAPLGPCLIPSTRAW